MERIRPEFLRFYDREVVKMITEKYLMDEVSALEAFWASEIYQMLRDPALFMMEYGPAAIFEMWEAEKVTGNPRNTVYAL